MCERKSKDTNMVETYLYTHRGVHSCINIGVAKGIVIASCIVYILIYT